MTGEVGRLGRVFWMQWVLATAGGLGLGFAVGWAVGDLTGGTLGVAVGKGVVWPVVGIMQWLLLRQKLPSAGGWIGAYLVAGTVVGVFAFAVEWDPGDVPAIAGGVILGVMVGTVGGVIQWRVLRGKHSGTGGWVLVSTFGWVLGLAFGFGVAHMIGLVGPRAGAGMIPQAVTGVLAGLASGVITGAGLVRLKR